MSSKFSLLKLSLFAFVCWLLFLITVSFFAERDPVFYDVLTQQDVSHQYQSIIPTIRYLFEPFLGVIFTLLSRDGIWLGIFILSYFTGRVLWLGSIQLQGAPLYKKVLGAYFDNWLRFQGRSFLLILLLILSGLLIGEQLRGPAFLQVYGLRSMRWGFFLAALLGSIKGLLIFLRFTLPGKKPVAVLSTQKGGVLRLTQWISGEIALFFYLFFTLVLMNFILISIPMPTQKIIFDRDENDYLFDFHPHTTYSDGYLTPSQRVDWYKDQGIDGAFFTDHNIASSVDLAKDYIKKNNLDFLVFHGEEYSQNEPFLHLLVYGIENDIFPEEYIDNKDAELTLPVHELIAYVKRMKGVLIMAHFRESYPFSMEELQQMGLQGFEVSTGYLAIDEKKIKTYCLSNKMLCVGGSDNHENNELRRFVRLQLEKPITVNKIFDQIRRGTHQVIRIELYPEKVTFENYPPLTMEFVEALMNYFLNLDKIQLLSWFVWSSILYLGFFRGAKKIKRMDDPTLQSKITQTP